MFDGKAFGQEIVAATKALLERSLAPIVIRINAIERTLAEQPTQPSAEDLTERFKEFIQAEVTKAVASIPVPKDGAPGRDGVDGRDGKDGQPGERGEKGERGDDGAPGEPGIPGRDGVDGKDGAAGRDGIDGKDGADGKDGRDGTDGKDGAPGHDGIGLSKALIGRDGNLVLTMTDGSLHDVGRVVGADGKDGLSASDFKIEWAQESDREISVTCSAPGSVSKSVFRFPVVLDCGVFKEGQTYQPGDGVTFAGSFWIAQAETAEKPDGGKGWRLAVKRGRDGKDGRNLGSVEPAQKVPLK